MDGGAPKRPPPEDDPFTEPAAAKRQALGPSEVLSRSPSLSHSLVEVSENDLSSKTHAELVSTVLRLHSAYSEQVADLRDQYVQVSQQLDELKSSLATYFEAQSSAIQSVVKHINPTGTAEPIRPRPSQAALKNLIHASTPSPGDSFRSMSTSSQTHPPARETSNFSTGEVLGGTLKTATTNLAATPNRQSLVSPSTVYQTPSVRPNDASAGQSDSPFEPTSSQQQHTPAQSSAEGGPPPVEVSHLNTVTDVWREYRYGLNGKPSIESLDIRWGARWRPEPKIRTWYSRRKVIYDKIKELMADGLDEGTAVKEVEAMRRGRSMNWVTRLLLDDRKETKANWKAAAAAARQAAQTGPGPVAGDSGVHQGPGQRQW